MGVRSLYPSYVYTYILLIDLNDDDRKHNEDNILVKGKKKKRHP
jgi:hypothetical protein